MPMSLFRPLRPSACALVVAIAGVPCIAAASDTPLPRRGLIGLAVQPGEAGGAVVTALRPDGVADRAGVRIGDELISIDGKPVASMDDLGVALRGAGGREVPIVLSRDGEGITVVALPEIAPPEEVAGSSVEYSSVTTERGYRLRTIITTPDESPLAVEGRHPAFMFVQGIYCASLDRPQMPEAVDTRLVHALAQAGFVTLRVDKAGLGDSEGPACSDIDFQEELEGYTAALAQLAELPTVDPDRIYIFGHSMGGLMAPYLSQSTPVAGAIVYGTLVRTWFEYQLENVRRQMELAGYPQSVVTQAVQAEARTSSMILIEKKTLGDVWDRYPELRNPSPMASETHMASRHMSFFHQLQDLNLAEAWAEGTGAVLAVYGEHDWVTSWQDHEDIAAIVNSVRPGTAEAVVLPKADHAFTIHDSLEASLRGMGQGEWDGSLPALVLDWIARVEGRPTRTGHVDPTPPAIDAAKAEVASVEGAPAGS